MTFKTLTISAFLACAGVSAVAQETTQQAVVGPSGDAVFSDQVLGANGQTYNCRPGLIPVDGQLVRRCVRVRGAAGGQLVGGAFAAPAALAALGVLVAVVAAGLSTSTTTN